MSGQSIKITFAVMTKQTLKDKHGRYTQKSNNIETRAISGKVGASEI